MGTYFRGPARRAAGLVENFLRMIRASTAARSYAKQFAQLIEIIGTLRRRFADLFVSNSFADAYVHASIQNANANDCQLDLHRFCEPGTHRHYCEYSSRTAWLYLLGHCSASLQKVTTDRRFSGSANVVGTEPQPATTVREKCCGHCSYRHSDRFAYNKPSLRKVTVRRIQELYKTPLDPCQAAACKKFRSHLMKSLMLVCSPPSPTV